jgi:hypothetical protein
MCARAICVQSVICVQGRYVFKGDMCSRVRVYVRKGDMCSKCDMCSRAVCVQG